MVGRSAQELFDLGVVAGRLPEPCQVPYRIGVAAVGDLTGELFSAGPIRGKVTILDRPVSRPKPASDTDRPSMAPARTVP